MFEAREYDGFGVFRSTFFEDYTRACVYAVLAACKAVIDAEGKLPERARVEVLNDKNEVQERIDYEAKRVAWVAMNENFNDSHEAQDW